jgi:hypothetical protein
MGESMTNQELRQWCLEFANEWIGNQESEAELLALAKSLWDFIDRAHVAE